MSSQLTTGSQSPPPPPKPIPVARPAQPFVRISYDFQSFRDRFFTPEGKKGLLISVLVHAVFIVIMAFIFVVPHKAETKTFDTTLESGGSPFGVEDGDQLLGGLDAPNSMPEPLAAPTEANGLTVLKTDEIASLDPSAGFKGKTGGNPGAGNGEGFGLAKFGMGGEVVRGVAVKVGDPQFTLLWDQQVDLDLHVIEPGGKEISWLDREGAKGGELDVDNREGFGPENIYWMSEAKDGKKRLSPGPAGEYRWWVVYYRGFNGATQPPTRWKVRVKANGEVKVFQGTLVRVDQKTQEYRLKIDPSAERPK